MRHVVVRVASLAASKPAHLRRRHQRERRSIDRTTHRPCGSSGSDTIVASRSRGVAVTVGGGVVVVVVVVATAVDDVAGNDLM